MGHRHGHCCGFEGFRGCGCGGGGSIIWILVLLCICGGGFGGRRC